MKENKITRSVEYISLISLSEISEKNLSAICVSSEAGESKIKTISRRDHRATDILILNS